LETKRRKQILDGTKAHLNQNMNTLVDWVSACDNKLSLSPPQAGAIAFVRINIGLGSQELTYHIRDNFSVLVQMCLGTGLEGFLRFGYGPPNDYLVNALERIGHSLDGI
jgi:bifunctional pyridoxal-dependent enzyme with beta-cystathionase and maltose regulon repressor activities